MSSYHDFPELEPEKWIERYADVLYSFAIARVRRQQVAEDLVQDTFLSAFHARASFQHQASEKTWLVAILKRKIIDYYRRKSTQNELQVLDRDHTDASPDPFFYTTGKKAGHWSDQAMPQSLKGDFETIVDTAEFQRILQQCLDKLPDMWAAVFTLKNMDDLASEEICKELEITPSNYWVIMHRAKLRLRACMELNWRKQ